MKKIIISVVSSALFFAPLTAHAEVSADTFSTSAHFIVLTKIRRFFTFTTEGRAQLTLAVENGLLVEAADQVANGKSADAAKTLTEFSTERAGLSNLVDSLDTTDRSTHHLLGDIASDDAHQIKDLTDLSSQVNSAKQLETNTTIDLAHLVGLPNLSAEDRQITMAEATGAVAEDATATPDKIAAKISLKNSIDDVTSKVEVKDALQHEENTDVSEAASLSNTELDSLVKRLDDSESPHHNLVVLQKLLNVVPENAMSGIETALDSQAEQEAANIEKDTTEVEKQNSDSSIPAQIRTAVLDRILVKVKSDDAKKALNLALNKASDDAIQQAKGGEPTETSKDGNNSPSPTVTSSSSSHGGDTTQSPSPKASSSSNSRGGNGSSSPSPTATTSSSSHGGDTTPSPSLSLSSTPSPSPTPSPSSSTSGGSTQQTSATIKVKNGGLDSSSITIKNNSMLTLQFENDDSNSATLTLTNGLTSGAVASNGKINLQSFLITGPVSFTVVENGITLSGIVYVQ